MPKHDHVAINQTFVAPTDESPDTRTATQRWLADPANIERLMGAIASGQSVRRFCEKEGISYSPVQRALVTPELEPGYREAQEQMAEHLLGEMERVSQLIEDGKLDGKDGGVILKNLEWRVTKLNQRRYSDRQVVEQHTFDHTRAQMEAVRQLARAQRPAIEGQVVRPALPAPDHGAAPLSGARTHYGDTRGTYAELVEPADSPTTIDVLTPEKSR